MVSIPEGLDRGHRLYCEIGGALLQLQAQDLTLAGVFVPTDDPFAVDRELEITLLSPIGELSARCLVVQVISRERALAEQRSSGCGVLFIDLEDDQRAWVGLTIAALARAKTAETAARRSERPERETLRSRPPPAPRNSVAPPSKRPERSLPPAAVRRPPRPNAPERPQSLQQLQDELAALQGRSPSAVLGLKEGADGDAARLAFLAMSKRYHPHAYAHLDSSEVSRVATELFIAHKRAYAAVCTSLRHKGAAPSTPCATPLVASAPPTGTLVSGATRMPSLRPATFATEIAFCNEGASGGPAQAASSVPSERPARRAVRPRQNTSPARIHNRSRAVEAELAFAAALKLVAASRFDEAAVEFERVCKLDPERRDADIWRHVCRARELMANGDESQARDAYRVVLGLDPEHHEALSQVGNEREAKKRPGLISRWFGSEDD